MNRWKRTVISKNTFAGFIKYLAFCLLTLPGYAAPQIAGSPTSATPPNLIVILTDDQRFDALQVNGNPHIHTPHLDALAARGVRFTQAHVVMSLCSPSRAAILTGRYGSANGVTSLDGPLRPGESTVAQHLAAAGYRTAHVGKWHIGGTPADAGFQFSVYFRGNGTFTGRQVWDEGREIRPPQHVDDYCVDRAIDFLEDAVRGPSPFLLFHATQLPHMNHKHAWPSPEEYRARYAHADLPLPPTWTGDLTGKPPYLETTRNRTQAERYGYRDPRKLHTHIQDYYAVITQLDGMIGRLLAAVDRLGLRDNTWIVFLSDNGWLLGEHRLTSKVLAYADSERVPLLIAGPGVRPRVESRLALNLDIAPTLLELADVAIPAITSRLHGASLLPLVRGESVAWREGFIYECLDGYGGTRPLLGAITPEWALVHTWPERSAVGDFTRSFVELYDRRSDPAETRNMAASPDHRDVRASLERMIREHLAVHPGIIESSSGSHPSHAAFAVSPLHSTPKSK